VKPKFLNVDLEVISSVDPTPLAKALGKKVVMLYCGPGDQSGHLITFEVCGCRNSPERKLAAFCDLLEELPLHAAQVWQKARCRTFDIGLESGGKRPHLALRIAPATLARITALGATIAITLYPNDSGVA
jgi:hypothetical protein